MSHRVVITGYGAMCSLGNTAKEVWEAATEGESGIAPITLYDASEHPIQYAAEIKDFVPKRDLDRRDFRRQDRFEWIANFAANEALEHSGIISNGHDPSRIGVAVSPSCGGIGTFEEQILVMHNEGPRRISPFTIPMVMADGASSTISIKHSLRGPSFAITSACASGADSIGMSLHLLRAGVVDAMVAGGTEAGITEFGVSTFHRMGVYSQRSDGTPSPFSSNRDGLIMGECSAVLILETLEHAKARGAEIYAELIGYGSSSDAYHLTAPAPDGAGGVDAINNAFRDAQITPDEIDYINAHGTGTELNDVTETKAIKTTFGERAYDVPVSATKSMTGHAIGATGALEAFFSIKAIGDNVLPPTINYSDPDPDCDLDYVPNEARDHQVDVVMSNAFGFGGHNSVLIFKSFEN